MDKSHAAWHEWTFLSAQRKWSILRYFCHSKTFSLMIILTFILFRHIVYYDDVSLTDYL